MLVYTEEQKLKINALMENMVNTIPDWDITWDFGYGFEADGNFGDVDWIFDDRDFKVSFCPSSRPDLIPDIVFETAEKIKEIMKYARKMDIGKRIEALKYYGTGDEGVELFQQTCRLCYSMVGLGQSEKAEILYQWAREFANASLAEIEEYQQDEFEHGQFHN